jgi:hypothetical protein
MDCVRRHPAFFHLRRSICTKRETNMRAFHPPQLHHIITRTRNFFHPRARPGPTGPTICRSRAKFAARERVATTRQWWDLEDEEEEEGTTRKERHAGGFIDAAVAYARGDILICCFNVCCCCCCCYGTSG